MFSHYLRSMKEDNLKNHAGLHNENGHIENR